MPSKTRARIKIAVMVAAVVVTVCWGAGCAKKLGREAVPETQATLSDISDTPSVSSDTLIDVRDGQKYRVTAIGGQTWMAENLNYGTVDGAGSWCYKNENSNCAKYGRLYDWETAMEVCPWGWHLPTGSEWDELVGWVAFVSGGDAGDKLKAKSGWRDHNGNDVGGTDDYGFSALPGGFRSGSEKSFGNALFYGYWWTATLDGNHGADMRNIDAYGNLGYRVNAESWRKDAGFSVRCVLDENRSGAYSLSLKSGPGGTAARFPAKTSYNAGKIVTISAYPKRGYAFVNWTGGKTANDTALTTTVTMNADMAVTANFRRSATLPEGESAFTDTRDGNVYITVKIRNQTWMAENLNYQPPTGNSWCYGNSLDSCAKYGRLYDWNTATAGKAGSQEDPSGIRGVCPEGWHLPSHTEWVELFNSVDSSHYFSMHGKKLKSKSGWENYKDGNGNGDDNFGFSALPGGRYGVDNGFSSAGSFGIWWTATEYRNGKPYNTSMAGSNDYTSGTDGNYKTDGSSVRCVMDKEGFATPPNTYTLTLKAGTGGTVSAKSGKASYNAGEKVTITAVPDKGYAFDKWIGGQVANAATATAVVSMNTDMAITANFRRADYAPLTDTRDGKEYRTAVIGGKTWMAQNLNYQTEGSLCYGNNNSNCNKYGRLYNWNAATTACPTGWHLPSHEEWKILMDTAGGWQVAAKKLKSIDGWGADGNSDGNGTDDYGFSALPGGYGFPGFSIGSNDELEFSSNDKRTFTWGGRRGYWWTATMPKDCEGCAYVWEMSHSKDRFQLHELAKNYEKSVRCVMDEDGSVTSKKDLAVAANASVKSDDKPVISKEPAKAKVPAKAKAPKQYKLKIKAKTGGTASAAPRKRAYPAGETVTLTAAPKKGYLFAHWMGGLTEDSASAVTAVTVNSDMAITAVFNKDATPRGAYEALADARDGKTYETVNIGGQTWMGENLNYEADNSVCHQNTPDKCQKYGRLYDMDAAKTACPVGWHLPSNQEWEDLVKYAGGKDGAGKKLKSTSGWVRNGNGTDVYGFSALPGSYGYSKDGFGNAGFDGYWWTSTEIVNAYGNRYAKTWEISYHNDKAKASEKSNNRLSVRCVLGEDPAAAAPITYSLTLTAGNGGTVSGNPNKASYSAGEKVSISAVPDSGYSFVKWTGRQVMNAASATTAASVNTNATITAIFRATPSVAYGTLTDARDGRTYKTATIDGKIWMARNLNYQADSSWCYGFDTSNCAKYGRLYDWVAARSACPAGWHLPTVQEWSDLFESAGGAAIAGKKLKAADGWDKAGNGDNEFDFSAPPGGRYSGGNFHHDSAYGGWWTATERDGGNAHLLSFHHDQDIAESSTGGKGDGRSVRCVSDGIESAGGKKAGAGFKDVKAGIEMAFVKGGTFKMGCTEEQSECDYSEETPVRNVPISDFYIGKYAVTQGQWKGVTGGLPSEVRRERGMGDDYPIYNVSWHDAQKFIRALNLKTGKTYRLPTEAEWEYAARGGTNSRGYVYSGGNKLEDIAWSHGNGGDITHPVGGKAPNELGLYDMSGNVFEWVNDLYGRYSNNVELNPQGSADGTLRVLRGGCYGCATQESRVAFRGFSEPDRSEKFIGFRLALPASQKIPEQERASAVTPESGAYWLTLHSAVGGTASANPNKKLYDAGEKVTITAAPNSGYTFAKWAGGPVKDSVSATATVAINSNTTVTAHFKTAYGTFTDKRDGKAYKTVKIGNQTWMAENLNHEPKKGNSWCLEHNADSCGKYGRLYDWETATKVCPDGWHLPTEKEWKNLFDAAGGDRAAGKTLKSASGWRNDGNGPDSYGFSALPGGFLSYNDRDRFSYAGSSGNWWTATAKAGSNVAEGAEMDNILESVASVHSSYKSHGFSVRCVSDGK